MTGMNMAEVLISKRREKGITQEELAAHVGVTKQSVSKWEKGNSYPDTLLLPQLASYFGISVDELIGYNPQMTTEDIRRLNMELLNDFATKSFDEAMNRCREIVKNYYSCFPLLYQIGTLFMNYGSNCEDEEQRASILTEAKELFVRVKTMCDNLELKHIALFSEAFCETELGNHDRVTALLENETRCSPQISAETLLANSYQKLGKEREAKAVMQGSILSSVIMLVHDMPFYMSICTEDKNHFEEVCERAIMMIDIFNVKKLSPLSALPFYITAADGYLKIGNTEKALDMLEEYTEIVTGVIYPQFIKGDDFFTLVDEIQSRQLNKLPFGMPEIPIDKQSLKQHLTEAITGNIAFPAFSALHENQRFRELAKKLK